MTSHERARSEEKIREEDKQLLLLSFKLLFANVPVPLIKLFPLLLPLLTC